VTIRKRGIQSAFTKERITALFLVGHFWREFFAEDFYMILDEYYCVHTMHTIVFIFLDQR
jgi:hypothetical protein